MDKNARTTSMDSRKLAVYEKLMGKPFTWHGVFDDRQIYRSATLINDRYNKFSNFVYANLEMQTTYSYLNLDFDLLKFDENLNKFTYDFSNLNSHIQILFNENKFDEIANLNNLIKQSLSYKPQALNLLEQNYKDKFSNDFTSYIVGLDKNDILNGTNKDDIIIANKGNDTIDGGYGNDIYVFNLGDGNDIIVDGSAHYHGGIDTIKFGLGISKEDLIVSRINPNNKFDKDPANLTDILIKFKNSPNDSITLKNVISNNKTNLNNAIENFIFSNGEILKFDDIKTLCLNPLSNNSNDIITGFDDMNNNISSLGGADILHGGNMSDILHGGWGNDEIYGNAGDDEIHGGMGFDILYGESGDDILIGGLGDDQIYGNNGDDTYIFNKGDGNDIIVERSGNDTIKFGDGINKDDLIVSKSKTNSSDLIIKFKTSPNDSITIKNIFSYNTIDQSSIIENFIFANGDKLSFETIKDFLLVGTDENDTIKSYNNINNTLIGGLGDDTLIGANGNDTYIFNLGDGSDTIIDTGGIDTIKFGEGISKDDLIITRYDKIFDEKLSDIVIKFKTSPNDKIIIKDVVCDDGSINSDNIIENFIFANGDKLSFETIKSMSLTGNNQADWIFGYFNENNIINGGDENDYIQGGSRDDIIIGGAGDDTLYSGAGDDTYIFNLGDGNDIIDELCFFYHYDDGGIDTLKFGSGISKDDLIISRSGSNYQNILIKFKNSPNDSITLRDAVIYDKPSKNATDYFEFENGEILTFDEIKNLALIGSDNDDIIIGYSDQDNVLIGGKGDDILAGKSGDDTYIFNLGDGKDQIYNYNGGSDTIKFGAGIDADEIKFNQNQNNLIIKYSDQDQITITDYFTDGKVENFSLEDGSILTSNQINKIIQDFYALGSDTDNFSGFSFADIQNNSNSLQIYG